MSGERFVIGRRHERMLERELKIGEI